MSAPLALPLFAVAGVAGASGTGLIFVQAGLAKLRHRALLPGVIANYRLLPEALVAPAAALLPPVELALGLALVVGPIALPAALVVLAALGGAGLLLVFAGAMAVNVRRGRSHIDCGCGRSQLRQPIGWPLVARNLALAALLLPALAGIAAPPAAGMLAGLATGLALFVFYQVFNAIVALAAGPLAAGRR